VTSGLLTHIAIKISLRPGTWRPELNKKPPKFRKDLVFPSSGTGVNKLNKPRHFRRVSFKSAIYSNVPNFQAWIWQRCVWYVIYWHGATSYGPVTLSLEGRSQEILLLLLTACAQRYCYVLWGLLRHFCPEQMSLPASCRVENSVHSVHIQMHTKKSYPHGLLDDFQLINVTVFRRGIRSKFYFLLLGLLVLLLLLLGDRWWWQSG
jgi:hypothetical protein